MLLSNFLRKIEAKKICTLCVCEGELEENTLIRVSERENWFWKFGNPRARES